LQTENDDNTWAQEARLWQNDEWTARVIKNDDDDGWAVAMFKAGHSEPALVGPWTMGRDKKNPKPLDMSAFLTLVKTAHEFVRRHGQQQYAVLHPQVSVACAQGMITVQLDIDPDEDSPSARLKAMDALGETLAECPVEPSFALTRSSAQRWIDSGFARPALGAQRTRG
jgi:hypothetical protein